MKILFVVNPVSGGGGKKMWMDAISAYFKGSPHSYEWYEMSGKDDAESLRHWIREYVPDRVVAIGGDGTLKFLAEETIGTGMPIAFLPAGSANGMAKELGLPADHAEAVKLAVEGIARKMDIVRVNGECSIHLSDIGLNAQLIKYFERSDRRGMWGYAREVFKVWGRKQKMTLSLEVDGKKMEREAWMVVIANAALYGTGVAINPDGSIHDGRFELVLMKKISGLEILKMIMRNRRFNRSKTEVLCVEQAVIRSKSPAYFQVDGEYMGEVTEVTCRVEKGAVEMVTGN